MYCIQITTSEAIINGGISFQLVGCAFEKFENINSRTKLHDLEREEVRRECEKKSNLAKSV